MEEISLIRQRNKDLHTAYKRLLQATIGARYVSRESILTLLQQQPAPRFYLTPYQAMRYICAYYQMKTATHRKQEMILDLVETYERLRKQYPQTTKTILYEMVVEQPAKSFYMSKHRIQEIVFNYSGRN